MNYVNWIGGAVVALILVTAVRRPVSPPDDPWFQNAVTNCPRPVLVKFGAEWCPPCRHMEDVLDRVEPRLSGRVKVLRIDIDQKPELAQHYGVSSIPRVFLFQQGQVVASHGGFYDADQVESWVKRNTR